MARPFRFFTNADFLARSIARLDRQRMALRDELKAYVDGDDSAAAWVQRCRSSIHQELEGQRKLRAAIKRGAP